MHFSFIKGGGERKSKKFLMVGSAGGCQRRLVLAAFSLTLLVARESDLQSLLFERCLNRDGPCDCQTLLSASVILCYEKGHHRRRRADNHAFMPQNRVHSILAFRSELVACRRPSSVSRSLPLPRQLSLPLPTRSGTRAWTF